MTATRIEATPLLACGCRLGEGPRWSVRNHELVWVDIEGCAFWRWSGSGEPVRCDLDSEPTCVFETAAGDYLLAIDASVCALSDCVLPADQRTPLRSYPDVDLTRVRTNDGRVDADGRLWLGTMARDLTTPAAALYRDGQRVLAGLTIANGIGWSPDGTVMYHVDTPSGVISRYAWDARGVPGRRGEFVRIRDGAPDGLAVDAAGGVWVALWGGGAVHRYDAAGRHTHTVVVPGVANVTSVAFGGTDLDLLFVTTASSGDPHSGDVFVAGVPHPGLPEHLLPTKGSTP